jgi:hypothetical protein
VDRHNSGFNAGLGAQCQGSSTKLLVEPHALTTSLAMQGIRVGVVAVRSSEERFQRDALPVQIRPRDPAGEVRPDGALQIGR